MTSVWIGVLTLGPHSPKTEFQWMDFFYLLAVVILGLVLMVSFSVLRIRKRKKSITAKNIADDLGEVRDDPNEPARWVP